LFVAALLLEDFSGYEKSNLLECIISGLNIFIARLKIYSSCQLKVSPPLRPRCRLSLGACLGFSPIFSLK